MADGLEGFTPEMQRLLRRAGINLQVGAGLQQGLSGGSGTWGRGLAPTAAEQAASPWYQLKHDTGVTPEGWLTDPGNPGVAAAKQKQVSPEVQKLLDQVIKARGIEAAGGRPDTRSKPNLLMRGLDYLGRPGSAAMGYITEASRETGHLLSPIDAFNPEAYKAGLRGAGRGLTAKERYHGSESLKEAGVLDGHRKLRAVAGFGADVATDPLTYLSFGAAKVAGTAGQSAAREAALTSGAKEAADAGARMAPEELAKHLRAPASRGPITAQAIETAAVDVGRQAATTARVNLVNDLVRVGMDPGRAKTAAVRWLNADAKLTAGAALEKETWLAKLRASPDALRPYLDQSAASIAAEARAATAAQLTALHAANAASEARRVLQVKAFGQQLGRDVPLPAAAVAAAARVGTFPGARQAISAFDRTFNTGTRFDKSLTALKARTAGLAERRIETVRSMIAAGFSGTNAEQRKALQEGLVGTGTGWAEGIVKLADGRDASDVIKETYDHVGRYVDWSGKGSGLISVTDLNRFLPKAYKFDKVTPGPAGSAPAPADLVAALVRRNPHLRTADPAQHLYALHIATEKAVARDQLARGVATFGIPVSPGGRNTLGPDGKIIAATSAAAKDLREKHGWSEIVTTGRDKELGASYGRHLEGMLFDPDTKRGVIQLLAVADDVTKRGELMRLYDKSLGNLKKVLTLPNPSFHLRNSFGDLFLGYLDDVSGPRGARSYEQAGRTMTAIRKLGQKPELRELLDGAVDPTTGQSADPIAALAKVVQEGRREPGPGARVMKAPKDWPDAPGGYLSAEQLWAAYNHAGLNRGFVSADLGDELRQGVTKARPVGKATDLFQDVSEARETYFRLAHFVDRVKRSKEATFSSAAEDAAHYVRKFHFDYHDVTPTEQAVFARLFPFYKFQRFAAPLMTQMFFARPGKIVNAQRALYATSDAAGYERDDMGLPTADQILPEYFSDASMIPLFRSAGGNTVYGNPGFPSTQIPAQTLGLSADSPGGIAAGIGQNLVGSVNPLVQAPFELATGRRVFGGGDVPVGPLPQYVAGKTPITNLAAGAMSGKDDQSTKWASFLTGLGLSENTPSRQNGALLDELARIKANRKKAGYVPAVTGRPGRAERSDSRGG